ncbi:MAG: hypothetical protein M3R63_15965 [Actinomycetota bacterium]|jgi:hypothetical protein|nr:hypothetical protein [Actinomycetota bacterium]
MLAKPSLIGFRLAATLRLARPTRWLPVARWLMPAGERVGSSLSRPASPQQQPSSTPGPTTGDPPPGFVRFLDDQRRFSIAYPADWSPLGATSDDVNRLVTKGRRRVRLLAEHGASAYRAGSTSTPSATLPAVAERTPTTSCSREAP